MKIAFGLMLTGASLMFVLPSQAAIAGQSSKQETARAQNNTANQVSSHNSRHRQHGTSTNKAHRRRHRPTSKK